MLVNVKIESEDLVDLLMNRLKVWTQDETILELYRKMYEDYCDSGCWDGCEFDVMQIVDNDWVNYCKIIDESDVEFDELLKIYKEQGLGDCSCECDCGCSFIEQVDNEEEPKCFLVRC